MSHVVYKKCLCRPVDLLTFFKCCIYLNIFRVTPSIPNVTERIMGILLNEDL